MRASKVGDLLLYTAKKNTLLMMTVNMSEVMKWHNHCGHLNVSGLGELSRNNLVTAPNLQFLREMNCTTCLKSKYTTNPFSSYENIAKELLDNSDIYSPVNNSSSGGAGYILLYPTIYRVRQ